MDLWYGYECSLEMVWSWWRCHKSSLNRQILHFWHFHFHLSSRCRTFIRFWPFHNLWELKQNIWCHFQEKVFHKFTFKLKLQRTESVISSQRCRKSAVFVYRLCSFVICLFCQSHVLLKFVFCLFFKNMEGEGGRGQRPFGLFQKNTSKLENRDTPISRMSFSESDYQSNSILPVANLKLDLHIGLHAGDCFDV